MEETKQTQDITRWNRAQRRNFRKSTHLTIPGRNLPYIKAFHGKLEDYYAKREEEISQEKNNG